MEIQINITQSARAKALFAKLENMPREGLAAVARGMTRAGETVLGRAKLKRFTGKGPFPFNQNRLGVVTQQLRKSLRATLPQINQSSQRVTMGFGSNVKYFGIHEFGFTGKIQVRGHSRRAVARGNESAKLNKKQINQRKITILVKNRGSVAYVKPHARNLTIAARAPMATELAQDSTTKSFLVEISRELFNTIDPKLA